MYGNGSSFTDGSRPQFGLFLPQIYPWPEMIEHAKLVEDLRFHSLWVADQFFSPYSAKDNWFECWTALSALAAVTESIRLGTGVTHIIYRNPAILARAALTVDHVSDGRLDLGIGVGSAGDFNHAMTGVAERGTRERVDRFQEAVILIDQLLRQRETTFEGSYYRVREASMNPPPVQQPRPPLNLAAHKPRTLKFAAQHADAWNSFYAGQDLTPEQSSAAIGRLSQSLSEIATELGRDPASIGRTFFAGYTSDTPFVSAGALDDFTGRYAGAGIDEFVFVYAPGLRAKELAAKWITSEEKLREAAQQLLPAAG